jgi:DNA ligase (NAD+)
MTDFVEEDRIKELEGLIAKARDDYYNKSPTVSDDVYNAWVDELSDLNDISPYLKAVGAPPVSEWTKVKHLVQMGSLDKVNTLEEMAEWVTTYAPGDDLLYSEKLDGISISVRYVNGKLTQALTRGDGKVGEDITVNVARMHGVPDKIPRKTTCLVRGEIVIKKTDFETHFKANYANTRNAASGIAKRYDGQSCEHLSVLFYKVLGGPKLDTEADQFRFLESMGLSTPGWGLSKMAPGSKTPLDIWVEYHQSKRDQLNYDIDGLVFVINDLGKQEGLGERDMRPIGAIAFKFAPATRETVLRSITWQTGGTGRITPVANFDVVNLLGAQIVNASLYNWKYINTLKLDVGSKILVARANDVIPRVVSVITGVGTIASAPSTCPSCGAEVVQEGEFHVCPNRDGCPAQVVGRLSQWLTNLGILEWGDVLLEKLTSTGLVKSIPDLYRLTEDQVAGLDRMGATSAAKALGLLHEKKILPLDLMLGSLCIPGIAQSTIRLLMDSGYDDIYKLRELNTVTLSKIKGIGPVKASVISKWVKENSQVVDELDKIGVRVQEPIRGKFSGMYFCFTGEMERKRGDLEQMVKDNGGEVKGSVTRKLTYLVLADTSTTKAATARKYGTKCLTEEEFISLVGL